MTTADSALDVQVRVKRFGGRRVLDDVRVRVAPGEIVCLVGASGCGKSTLLRIAAGLDREFEGFVRVGGRPHDAPTREVGVVFQEPRLFPWCSVADNIAFETGGARRDDPRVAAILDDVGLSGRGAALPRELSGGQAQRVALARALAGQPRVLLLDEPFSAVDAFTRMKLQDLLVGLVRRQGIATLMVTHDIDEAAWLADRVLVLDANPGRLREQVPVPITRPRTRDDLALAAPRARVFHALQAAHAI
ncbi:MAG: ABC transporter ATP-binding protein [Caulobacter sp.]|nr:ABC transporter ATP-binding protein [Vitreoscilla sp.]